MKTGNKAVVGVFEYMDDTLAAIEAAKSADYEFQVYSPVPNHHLDHAAKPGRSPVRRLSLTGGLTGLTFGFTLAIMCSLDYPMRVSAKDVVSIPGFVVVGYECTILFTALFTLFAIGFFGKVPHMFRRPGYDPRFSYDRFGVVVNCQSGDVERLSSKFKELGAEEIKVEESI
jgi:hypothetical protein